MSREDFWYLEIEMHADSQSIKKRLLDQAHIPLSESKNKCDSCIDSCLHGKESVSKRTFQQRKNESRITMASINYTNVLKSLEFLTSEPLFLQSYY